MAFAIEPYYLSLKPATLGARRAEFYNAFVRTPAQASYEPLLVLIGVDIPDLSNQNITCAFDAGGPSTRLVAYGTGDEGACPGAGKRCHQAYHCAVPRAVYEAATAHSPASPIAFSLMAGAHADGGRQLASGSAAVEPYLPKHHTRIGVAGVNMLRNGLDPGGGSRLLTEWFEHHRMLGFERFYIFDNNSTDATADALDRYAATGLVWWWRWPYHLRRGAGQSNGYVQRAAMQHALLAVGHHVGWLALFDTDEFFLPPKSFVDGAMRASAAASAHPRRDASSEPCQPADTHDTPIALGGPSGSSSTATAASQCRSSRPEGARDELRILQVLTQTREAPGVTGCGAGNETPRVGHCLLEDHKKAGNPKVLVSMGRGPALPTRAFISVHGWHSTPANVRAQPCAVMRFDSRSGAALKHFSSRYGCGVPSAPASSPRCYADRQLDGVAAMLGPRVQAIARCTEHAERRRAAAGEGGSVLHSACLAPSTRGKSCVAAALERGVDRWHAEGEMAT